MFHFPLPNTSRWLTTLTIPERHNIRFFIPLLLVYGMALTTGSVFSLLWMKDKGFSLATIGIIGGIIPLCLAFMGNIAGTIGDGTGKRRWVIIGMLMICMLCVPVVYYLSPSIVLYVVTVLFFVSLRLAIPMLDSIISQLFPIRDDRSFNFLWLRSLTTLGGIIGLLAASKIYDAYGINNLPWISLGLLSVCLVLMLWFDDTGIPRHNRGAKYGMWALMGNLLQVPWFKPFILFNILYGLGNAFYYGFFTIHLQNIGLTKLEIAITFAAGLIMEIVIFFIGRRLIRNIRPTYLLAVCGIIAPIRWILFTQFDDVVWLSLVALLHGITFSLHWAVSSYYIQRNVPSSLSATAQTVWQSSCLEIPFTIIIPISGILYPIMGANIFILGAFITTLSICVSVYMIQNKPVGKTI